MQDHQFMFQVFVEKLVGLTTYHDDVRACPHVTCFVTPGDCGGVE
jgi:hypothetical protein